MKRGLLWSFSSLGVLIVLWMSGCRPGGIFGAPLTPTPPMTTESPLMEDAASRTSTKVMTDTPIPTSTFTPEPTYNLSGNVYFDYNGNGERDDLEPPIENVVLELGMSVSDSSGVNEAFITQTDENGEYTFKGLFNGQYSVSLESPHTGDPEKSYRYISLSDEEFQPMDGRLSVMVDGDINQDWGLMQGFLTLPIKESNTFSPARYYDWDQTNSALYWNGISLYDPNNPNHIGVDIPMKAKTDIVAAAPGFVDTIGELGDGGLFVVIRHNFKFYTNYDHVSDILVEKGDRVKRGQVIARYGRNRYNPEPHLHFYLAYLSNDVGNKLLDSYRPITNVNPGYWSFIDPFGAPSWENWVWIDEPNMEPNGLGFWTVDNNPQFFNDGSKNLTPTASNTIEPLWTATPTERVKKPPEPKDTPYPPPISTNTPYPYP